jgi:AcrR family transcriptional regulator
LTIPYSTAMALSREDWTAAALDALAEVGLSAVAIDPLARRLGTTKGSFYWHFSSRDELIAATLELWERRDTLDLLAALAAIDDPQERLVALAREAYGTAARGTDPQAGVLAAASDPRVGPVLERVTVARLAALEELFGDVGLEPAEARRRARVAYALYVGVIDLRRAAPSARLAEAEIKAEIELMVSALVRAR